jgi:Type I phosphodiesterase / nucleotide pyrophosphatase
MIISRRLRLLAAILLMAVACTGGARSDPGETPGTSSSPPMVKTPQPGQLARMACGLPPEQLLRIWRGSPPDRVGDVLIVPKEPNFVDGGISHAGPWEYVQHVPLLLLGPGYIEPAGSVDRPVTLADVAPTLADLLDFDFEAPDGEPLSEALVPRESRPGVPPLIFTLVWDAAGRNVLDAWPGAWPTLAGLIDQGTWYEEATVGSSPSVTPPSHTTLGTGAFPIRHGLSDNQVRVDGAVVGAWQEGPAYMRVPALGDEYDAALDNEPLIGAVATLTWHLSMIGHGSAFEGGDRDIAVLRQKSGDEGAEGETWNLPRNVSDYYAFPSYVNDLTPLEEYVRVLDQADGALDGLWMGNSIEEERKGFNTPARIPYETLVIQEVLRREGFGADAVGDLFYANYKIVDEIGHRFTMNSPEMRDTIRAQDQALADLIEILNDVVGQGRWVLVVTADHGHTPDPNLSGAFRIAVTRLEELITAAFDDDDDQPVLQKVRPTQVYLDVGELEENGFTVDQVALFLARLTKGQTAKNSANVPSADRSDRVFEAAFPTSVLQELACLPAEATL